MKHRKILFALCLFSLATIAISCSSSKKVGCYYGDSSEYQKEITKEKTSYTKAYKVAE